MRLVMPHFTNEGRTNFRQSFKNYLPSSNLAKTPMELKNIGNDIRRNTRGITDAIHKAKNLTGHVNINIPDRPQKYAVFVKRKRKVPT